MANNNKIVKDAKKVTDLLKTFVADCLSNREAHKLCDYNLIAKTIVALESITFNLSPKPPIDYKIVKVSYKTGKREIVGKGMDYETAVIESKMYPCSHNYNVIIEQQ